MDLIDRQALLRKLFPYEVVDKKKCAINAYAVERAIMDMPKKEFDSEAIDYLEHILEDWPKFCECHQPLVKAIEILLEEIKSEH